MSRVAHVISTPASPGGGEVVVRQLVHGFASAGWDQQVLNPFASLSLRSDLVPAGVDARYAFRKADSVRDLPGLRRWLLAELREFRPDLVHGHLFHASVALGTIPRARGQSRILTHHHGRLFEVQGRRLHAVLDRWATSRFDHVVAVSDDVRRLLSKSYALPDPRISVIRNGWDERFGRITPAPSEGEIVCIGNLRREKGVDVLLRAMAILRAASVPAHLTIVGDGPLRGELEQLARIERVDDLVSFVGYESDVLPRLEKATLFCLTSSYETLGIAVLEAMAAGLPVVATRVGGLPEVVEEGVTGYLVEPGDQVQLARRIIEIFRSPGTRERMGAAARAAAASYSTQTMTESYLDLYNSLTRSPS